MIGRRQSFSKGGAESFSRTQSQSFSRAGANGPNPSWSKMQPMMMQRPSFSKGGGSHRPSFSRAQPAQSFSKTQQGAPDEPTSNLFDDIADLPAGVEPVLPPRVRGQFPAPVRPPDSAMPLALSERAAARPSHITSGLARALTPGPHPLPCPLLCPLLCPLPRPLPAPPLTPPTRDTRCVAQPATVAQSEEPDSPTRALDADAASASFGAARAALSSQIRTEPASPKDAAAKRSGDRSPAVRDSLGLLSLSGKSPLSFSGESPSNRELRVEGERPMVKSRVETASDQLRRGRELLKEDKPLLAEAMVRLALQGFQDCLGAHHLETSRAARSLMEALVKQAVLRKLMEAELLLWRNFEVNNGSDTTPEKRREIQARAAPCRPLPPPAAPCHPLSPQPPAAPCRPHPLPPPAAPAPCRSSCPSRHRSHPRSPPATACCCRRR